MAKILQLGNFSIKDGGGIGPVGPGGDPHKFGVKNATSKIFAPGGGIGVRFRTLADLRFSIPQSANRVAKIVILAGFGFNEEVLFTNKTQLLKAAGSKGLKLDPATIKAAAPHILVGNTFGVQVEVPLQESGTVSISSVFQNKAPATAGKKAFKKSAGH